MPRQFGEDALRLAECVTEQHRCKAFRTILRPPLEDLGTRGAVRRPYILRRTEGRFGDEHIARHNLEWCTTRIVVTLVIAGHDPDLAVDLDTEIGRESCRERVCQYG